MAVFADNDYMSGIQQGCNKLPTVSYAWQNKIVIVLHSICTFLMVSGIIGRMISGVSWFTDILGGIGFGLTLLLIYSFFFDI